VGADIGLRRQDIRETGFQKHIVEREGFTDTLKSLRHCQLLSAAHRRDQFLWMNAASGDAIGIAVESKPIGGVDGGR
jgi:hypothetical protein